jgi:hypothetical protein
MLRFLCHQHTAMQEQRHSDHGPQPGEAHAGADSMPLQTAHSSRSSSDGQRERPHLGPMLDPNLGVIAHHALQTSLRVPDELHVVFQGTTLVSSHVRHVEFERHLQQPQLISTRAGLPRPLPQSEARAILCTYTEAYARPRRIASARTWQHCPCQSRRTGTPSATTPMPGRSAYPGKCTFRLT